MREADIVYLDMTSFNVTDDMTREDCYSYCGNKSGYCDVCGYRRACCKEGDPNPVSECLSIYGSFLTDHYECVKPTNGTTTITTTTEGSSGFPWWGWLLVALGVLCCLGLLVAAFMMMGSGKPKKKKKRNVFRSMEAAAPPQASAPMVYTAVPAPMVVQAAPVHLAPVTRVPATPPPGSYVVSAPVAYSAAFPVTYSTAPVPAMGSYMPMSAAP